MFFRTKYVPRRKDRHGTRCRKCPVDEQFVRCKDTIKPRAKTNLFVLCRGGVSKTKSKIGIKLRQKQILFAFCRSGTESKIRKAERKREFVHSFPGRILSSTKIDAGLHVKISGPKSYPSPSKYNPRQNKIGLFDRGVISRCAA